VATVEVSAHKKFTVTFKVTITEDLAAQQPYFVMAGGATPI